MPKDIHWLWKAEPFQVEAKSSNAVNVLDIHVGPEDAQICCCPGCLQLLVLLPEDLGAGLGEFCQLWGMAFYSLQNQKRKSSRI